MEVKVNQDDFSHPSMIDTILHLTDKKYGVDNEVSLHLGAKVLRLQINDYKRSVKSRRLYYDK